jgi:hypothetical protein
VIEVLDAFVQQIYQAEGLRPELLVWHHEFWKKLLQNPDYIL